MFEAWRQAGGLSSRARLTDDRRRKIRARLREYPVEDVADAARGIWRSDWNVEHGQTDLSLALRDGAHLERFRDAERGLGGGARAQPLGRHDRAMKQALESGTVDTGLLDWAYQDTFAEGGGTTSAI